MSHIVYCVVLKKELEGLDFKPVGGDLGDRIYDNVSKDGWQEWLTQQTILINENRLSLVNADHKVFLKKQMEEFFFGTGAAKPEGWVSPNPK